MAYTISANPRIRAFKMLMKILTILAMSFMPYVKSGPGPANEKEPCICTLQYSPVCGTDGKIRGNLCGLECDIKSAAKQQSELFNFNFFAPCSFFCFNFDKTTETPQCSREM